MSKPIYCPGCGFIFSQCECIKSPPNDLKRNQMLANDILRYARRVITDDQIETANVRILIVESENGDLYYIRRMNGSTYDVINLSNAPTGNTRWHIYKNNQ